MAPTPPTPERHAANSLPAASLLAFTGGSLDAFLYLQHGKVFAGAMTGNAVLTGIAVLSHNHADVVRHGLPIVAFLAGIWVADFLDSRVRRGVFIGLVAEILGLTVASFLPQGFPDDLFVPFISLLAAYQIASFRRVDDYAYNSTFITGNLRTIVDGLYSALDPIQRRESLRKALELATIVASFITGAVAGAILAPRTHNHTLWLCIAALLSVLGITIVHSKHDFDPAS